MTNDTNNRPPRIALINPRINRWKLFYWYFFFGSREFPLGLLYIASYLKDNGYDVILLDGEKQSESDLFRKLDEFKPDIIGVTSTSFAFHYAADTIKKCRAQHPDSFILIGGTHPSLMPMDTIERIPELNGVLVGEGEEPFLQLAKREPLEAIGSLYWRDKNGEIKINPTRPVETNLDKYQLHHELIENFPQKYGPSIQSKNRHSSVAMVVSRGCAYPCTFCASTLVHGKKIRKQSARYVIDQMLALKKKYGMTDFYFHDDHFTLDRKWIYEFCELLIAEKHGFSWKCATRVEPLNDELLDLMHAAGCIQVGIGIESGSDEVLTFLHKNVHYKKLEESIKRITSKGITVKGYIMIGLPTEQVSDLFATMRLLYNTALSHIQILYFTPLPGTQSYIDYPVPAERWGKLNLLTPMKEAALPKFFLRPFEISLYGLFYSRKLIKSIFKNG